MVGRRASGRVLDIGASNPDDLPSHAHLCHLALVGAGEVRDSELPLHAEKVDAAPEDLPFPDRSFDVVVCRFALTRAQRPALATREIARVLRRTGQLLFLDTAATTRLDVDALMHLRHGGLITHDVDWSWPRSKPPLVQGVATHPAPQYVREIAWLRGAT
ncbi:class I SAM-dependent methyltransferase [Saccharopolyspora endophytica]|uniref:Methyltransferase domain-containing protein n=1 Tax=Saccharopolyspora endophytica TaxID=543886 RepID=A0ABS5DIE4_9PSEU|nr:methyltransferase domain-containing protein [Saccharopolyspora endophytica]MBQ0926059.1 methyltransferase domain-containing protein [Saccharopolyspora endophytica]